MAFLGLAMLAMLVALALPKDIAARSRNSRLCYKSSCNLADLWESKKLKPGNSQQGDSCVETVKSLSVIMLCD